MGTQVAEDRSILVEAVRKFARSELLEADRQRDIDESPICDFLPAVAEMGLMGLTLLEELGGLNCDMRTYAAIIRELAYASPSMSVALSVHTMTSKIFRDYATSEWKDEHLANCATADGLTAFALSEADSGSDASSVRTQLTRVDGGFKVTGSKMWISNGTRARWFLVLTRSSPPSQDESEFTAVIVDANESGVERDKIEGKMGIRASDTVVLHMNDVFVPDRQLLGQQGQGLKVFLGALDEGRIGIAAQAAGIAEACLDEMTSYARERIQFGKPIAEFQAIQNMVADSAVDLEAATLLIERAAHLVDTGRKCRSTSSMAKLYASEAANRIAYRAVQVHGGTGYVRESRVEQLFRDARVTTIYEGTSEIQRYVIAKDLVENGVAS